MVLFFPPLPPQHWFRTGGEGFDCYLPIRISLEAITAETSAETSPVRSSWARMDWSGCLSDLCQSTAADICHHSTSTGAGLRLRPPPARLCTEEAS